MINNISKLKDWQIKKLPEVVFFQEGPGVRNNQYTQTGVKLLNVANLVEGQVVLENTNRYISEEEAYGKYNHFLVDEGDLIIASSGIKVEYFDKKMGFVKKEHLPLCMNTSTIRFKSLDNGNLNLKYFSYFLKSIYFKKQIARLITGSAQLNFGPSHLKQIDVIVPPINIQNNIVNILDKSKYLIDKRKEQIESLDELVKSQFIEMFSEVNEYVSVSEYIESLTAGKSLAGESECKNKVLNTGSISYDYFDMNQVKNLPNDYIPKEEHLVNVGDVLISRMNTSELVGATAYVWNVNPNTYIPDRLWKANFKPNCNPIFVWQLLIQSSTKEKIRRIASGTSGSMKNISKPGLLGIEVIKVDIEKQNEFANFVKQVDKLKFEMENSLKELEDNFNSLMQKAFKGELFI